MKKQTASAAESEKNTMKKPYYITTAIAYTSGKPPVPSSDSHTACVMFAGFDEKTGQEDLVFLAVNAHWIAKQLVLPSLPNGYVWKIAVNTGDLLHQTFSGNDMPTAGQTVLLGERSVIVFAGMKQAETASL